MSSAGELCWNHIPPEPLSPPPSELDVLDDDGGEVEVGVGAELELVSGGKVICFAGTLINHKIQLNNLMKSKYGPQS